MQAASRIRNVIILYQQLVIIKQCDQVLRN